MEIYFAHGQEGFTEALGGWFQNKDSITWFSEFGMEIYNEKIESLLKLQRDQIKDNELIFTPTLIVGEFLYPELYDISDLIYFISELKHDEDLMSNL